MSTFGILERCQKLAVGIGHGSLHEMLQCLSLIFGVRGPIPSCYRQGRALKRRNTVTLAIHAPTVTEIVLLEPIRPHNGLGPTSAARRDNAAPLHDPIAPIRAAPANRPFVVAQLGQSLDGRIATPSGESRWINGAAALDHVHRLRANVDAVVVGVGTAISDDPLLTVRRTSGRHPARVVIDPNGRLPACAKCLNDDGTRRVLIRRNGHGATSGAEVLLMPDAGQHLCPRAISERLFAMGLKKILVEGGARTVSAFIDADAVDRLHVLVAPMLLGSGTSGLSLAPIGRLAEARRPETTAHVLSGGEVLFDCNLRRSA